MTRPPLYEHAWVDVVRPQHVPGMLTDGRVTEREFEQFDEQVIEAQTALAELRDRLRGMVVPESTLRRVR